LIFMVLFQYLRAEKTEQSVSQSSKSMRGA